MKSSKVLRVVVHRKGRVKPAEFYLRPGDAGLSLFQAVDSPDGLEIIEAVQAAGKRGDLAIAEIPVTVFEELGLRLVSTPGGTPDDRVNRLHVEARWSWWQRIKMMVRGVSFRDRFNDEIAPQIAASAIVVTGETP